VEQLRQSLIQIVMVAMVVQLLLELELNWILMLLSALGLPTEDC
jgi:hypothetical protein